MLYTKHPSTVRDYPAAANYYRFPASGPSSIFGSALVGAYYSDLGYNQGTGAWADQTTNGNNLTASGGAPTFVSNAFSGKPGIQIVAASSQELTNTSFTGLAAGSRPTLLILARQDGTAKNGVCYLSGTGISIASAVESTASAARLLTSDWNASFQANAKQAGAHFAAQGEIAMAGSIGTRDSRLHWIEHSIGGSQGATAVQNSWDLQDMNLDTNAEAALPNAATTVRFGRDPISAGYGNLTFACMLVVSRGVTSAEKRMLAAWSDSVYGTTFSSDSKQLLIMGQSNANKIMSLTLSAGLSKIPLNCNYQMGAVDGSSMASSWNSTDPQLLWADAAGFTKSSSVARQHVVLWDQGESDNTNSNYASQLAASRAYYESLGGRSDSLWIVVRIPLTSGGADNTIIRAQQASFCANNPRAVLIDSDDIPTSDGTHYTAAGCTTLFTRCMDAANTYFGSSTWSW